ncbi:MAG TPA: hypothetical protein DCY13_19955 [Verrucomicrobiales bacterium]|nr:hypothetical protein [Verrucomicrobiales bacterium]
MVLKHLLRGLLLALLLAVGFWVWKTFFPGDEALIRRQLVALAEAASFGSDEAPLVKLTNAARVAGFFTADTEIDIAPWGYQRVVISGHTEVQQAAVGARNAVASLSVRVENIEITFRDDPAGARVRCTLTGRTSRESETQSQEMELEMLKLDGDWLIHRARTFDYIRN